MGKPDLKTSKSETTLAKKIPTCFPPKVSATLYCINHSWEHCAPIIPALLTDSPFSFPPFDLRQEPSIFAKRSSQSLAVRREKLQRSHRRGGWDLQGEALMRCPQRCPCARAGGSRCNSTFDPRGHPPHHHHRPPRPRNFISVQGGGGGPTRTSLSGKSWVTDVVNHLYYEW